MQLRSPIIGTLAVLILAGSCLAAPSERARNLDLWLEAPGYEATVTDQEGADAVGGLVYTDPSYRRLLFLPDKNSLAFVFELSTKSAFSIPRTWLDIDDAGARVPSQDSLSFLGACSQEGTDLSFDDESQSIRIGPKPHLVGEVTLETILTRKPGYKTMAADYTPNPQAIATIRQAPPTEIVIFFGTWCTTCARRISHFLKIIDAAENPRISVRYVAVAEDYSEPESLLRASHVSNVPTFVVMRDGTELGRIDRRPRVTLEQDFAEILSGASR